jgi:hypothetical protein
MLQAAADGRFALEDRGGVAGCGLHQSPWDNRPTSTIRGIYLQYQKVYMVASEPYRDYLIVRKAKLMKELYCLFFLPQVSNLKCGLNSLKKVWICLSQLYRDYPGIRKINDFDKIANVDGKACTFTKV